MLGVEAADNVLFGTKARPTAVLQSARASTIPAEQARRRVWCLCASGLITAFVASHRGCPRHPTRACAL